MLPEDLPVVVARDGVATFVVRVRAGARVTRWLPPAADGTLRVDVRGQAERGKANAALLRFIADHCDVPLNNVALLAGSTSPRKTVRITARR